MGTVLSISPTSKKEAILDDRKEGDHAIKTGSVKNNSMLVPVLTLKKLFTTSTKKNSCKKVNPNAAQVNNNSHVDQQNNENNKKSQQSSTDGKKTPLAVPVPAVPTQSLEPNQPQVPSENVKLSPVQKQPSKVDLSPRRVIIQASTGELLRCLGEFVCRRCCKVKLTYNEVILWFRNVDRTLLLQGWQDQGFITPANLVFVYLLCKESIPDDIDSASELHGIFLLCLYLSYSYMGCEISYPLKPFMIMENEDNFWDCSMSIINNTSAKMLQLNADPHFFTEVFQELKDEGESRDKDLDR
ncbi:cyclin-dependent kinase 5 activator 1-like [Oncorhynchus nerka]|uniref:cyclin-dependent kinase 5 activator 1-like n=1 Tax=Oncorhynchus nerka TaxID=8023 RepID=UPI001131E1C5|nr:cyclin-dependent kinase 5 activator 1-like [Oncorhynchus nerka]